MGVSDGLSNPLQGVKGSSSLNLNGERFGVEDVPTSSGTIDGSCLRPQSFKQPRYE